MSYSDIPLFILPVHRCSYKKYRDDYENWVEKRRKRVEDKSGEPFDRLDDETKDFYTERWLWPPWKFNEIIGYVDIWMKINKNERLLSAYIFLKRKHFRRTEKKRLFGHYSSLLKNHEFFYYRKTDKIKVFDINENSSYVETLSKVLVEVKKILKERNRNFKLWLPPYGFTCFNFIEVYKQVSEK